MFELLNSLTDNLQVLDGVRAVFENGASDDDDDESAEFSQYAAPPKKRGLSLHGDDSEEAEKIIESIPEPKKV